MNASHERQTGGRQRVLSAGINVSRNEESSMFENYPTEGWRYWAALIVIALLGFAGLLFMMVLQWEG